MSDPLQQDAAGQYLAYRSAIPEQAAGDALLKEMQGGADVPHGTPQAPATAPQEMPANASEHGMPYRIAADVGRGLTLDQPRAIYSAVRDSLQNVYDMTDDFGQWIENKTGFRGIHIGANGIHLTTPEEEQTSGMGAVRSAVDATPKAEPTSTTGGLFKGVYQFLSGLSLTNRTMAAANLPTELEGAAGYGLSALKGAAANFAAFDPHQQRLSNLIEKFPALSNPVTEYLASKPDDSAAEGRFKNALEGLGLGVLTDGFVKGVRLLRGAMDAKTAAEGLPEGELAAEPGIAADAFRELGDERPEAPLVADKPFTPPASGAAPSPQPVGARSELENVLRGKSAESATSGVTPEEVAGAKMPEEPKTYINFARINTPQDVQAVTQQLADRFNGSIEGARRGTQTFEQIKLNSEMENAWDILQRRRIGEPLNAEQSVAARELWASSADKLKQLAQTASDAPTPENLFAFRKMMATHYAIQQEVIGARTETARALASWRIPVGSSASRLQDITERMMDMGGGPDAIRLMAQHVRDLSEADMPHELEQYVAKSAYARTRDALIQAFSDGLLSSPVTQTKILASNVSTGLWRIGERVWAAKISQALGTPDGVQPSEAAAMWSGWIGSVKDGLAYASKAMRTGVTGEGIGEPHEPYPSNISSEALNLSDHPWLGRAADFIGSMLSFGRRGIAAQHDMALTMAYRGELNAQAVRQATSEVNAGSLKPEAFNQRVAALLADPPAALQQAARDGAKYQAFLDEPGKIAQWLLEGRRQIPALRVIAPFIKIPARIMSYTFERTPLAPLMSEFRAKIAAGGATRDLALAQMSMGSLITMAAADMTLSGTLKGGGSNVKGVEQAEEREGAMRDSVKVGNRWYNINGVHPAGKLMLLAADVAENVTQGQTELHDPDEVGKILMGTTMAIARTMVDNSYFQGVSNLFAAVHDANVKGGNMAGLLSTAGGAVPAVSGALARADDPYQREVYSMLDEFKSKIPGLSKTLPPRRDLWGDPVPSGHDPITNLFSPVRISDEKHSAIDDEIIRQGFNIDMPDRHQTFKSQGGGSASIDMSKYPAAYSRLLELAGHEVKSPAWGVGLKDLLNSVVSGNHPLSAVYNLKSDGPEGGKEIMIRDLISQYRDLAKRQLLDEYPAIRAEVDQKAAAARALKLGSLQ